MSVFSSSDVPLGCDSNIPLLAQELMKKMIHQFAMEYASKCLLHTNTNGVTTTTSSPLSETSDAPLDLTVSRTQEEKQREPEPGRQRGNLWKSHNFIIIFCVIIWFRVYSLFKTNWFNTVQIGLQFQYEISWVCVMVNNVLAIFFTVVYLSGH